MRIGEITGGTAEGMGSRNPQRKGPQGTAQGSRVQNREIEDGGYKMPGIGFR